MADPISHHSRPSRNAGFVDTGSAESNTPDSGINPQDWDSLFGAIEERLVEVVAVSGPTTTPVNLAGKVRDTVLECVEAMKQLHAALKADRVGESLSRADDPPVAVHLPGLPGRRGNGTDAHD